MQIPECMNLHVFSWCAYADVAVLLLLLGRGRLVRRRLADFIESDPHCLSRSRAPVMYYSTGGAMVTTLGRLASILHHCE